MAFWLKTMDIRDTRRSREYWENLEWVSDSPGQSPSSSDREMIREGHIRPPWSPRYDPGDQLVIALATQGKQWWKGDSIRCPAILRVESVPRWEPTRVERESDDPEEVSKRAVVTRVRAVRSLDLEESPTLNSIGVHVASIRHGRGRLRLSDEQFNRAQELIKGSTLTSVEVTPASEQHAEVIEALIRDMQWQIAEMKSRGIKDRAGRPYTPHYYKRGLTRAIERGGLEVVEYLRSYLYKAASGGFEKLEDADALDLACEALIVDEDKPYAYLFTDEDRGAARRRLASGAAVLDADHGFERARRPTDGERFDLSARPMASSTAVKFVPIESMHVEGYELNSPEGRRKAERIEQRLVSDYADYMRRTAGADCIGRYVIPVQDGASSIFCDAFNAARNQLIEAKAAADRESIRMAIGQLADYAHHLPGDPAQAVLLPERPNTELAAVLKGKGIAIVWRDGDGFADDASGAYV